MTVRFKWIKQNLKIKTSEPADILDLTCDKPKISRVDPSKLEEFLKLLNI